MQSDNVRNQRTIDVGKEEKRMEKEGDKEEEVNIRREG